MKDATEIIRIHRHNCLRNYNTKIKLTVFPNHFYKLNNEFLTFITEKLSNNIRSTKYVSSELSKQNEE